MSSSAMQGIKIMSHVYAKADTPTVKFTRNKDRATIKFKHKGTPHQLSIYFVSKNKGGGVRYQMDGGSIKPMKIKDKSDFVRQINAILNEELGTKRTKVDAQLNKTYDTMRLVPGKPMEVIPVPQQQTEQAMPAQASGATVSQSAQSQGILQLKEGVYTLQKEPVAAYLLVRNDNIRSTYCLSMVQEIFDLMYGVGSGKQAGLFSSKMAESLSFPSETTVSNYDSSKQYPVGSILRMGGSYGGMTHVGIIIRPGVAAHLIRDELYIERVSNSMGGGSWKPVQIAVPNQSILSSVQSKVTIKKFRGLKNNSLESVSGDIIKALPGLKNMSYNLAVVEEIIYQLNREKFEIKLEGRFTIAKFKSNELKIPDDWIKEYAGR